MKKTRREFLELSAALGMAPLIGSPLHKLVDIKPSDKKLKILVLGGTSFLGPHQIAYALERGHEVSTFTRGKTIPKIHANLFDKVESLVGDREDNLDALKGRKWDVVIDNSGRKVKWTEDTAKLLKDNVGIYMYTSSISVYYPFTGDDFSEQRQLVTEIPEGTKDNEKPTYEYGVMKANSELAAIKHFGKERSIIVRPSLIVGPGDRTDRFPYWLARIEKGGDIILPGKADEVVQYIDVRDLAQWMIRLLFVHIDDNKFLEENGVIGIQPWVIQLPQYAGMSQSDNSKAIESGLTFSTLSNTVMSTKSKSAFADS